jgi:prepilin-type N-terminal cleavage/methylation domain-containing protein
MEQKGFTIIELVISIFILTVAVVGIYGAFSLAIILSSDASNRLTAAYLVQEGQEIVRNIRDTNWLKNGAVATNWIDSCLNTTCTGDFEADYTDAYVSPWTGRHLNINGDGFYVYASSPTKSKFERKITITQIDSAQDVVLVKVEVSWDEKSNLLYPKQAAGTCNTGYNCVEAEVTLYNWY